VSILQYEEYIILDNIYCYCLELEELVDQVVSINDTEEFYRGMIFFLINLIKKSLELDEEYDIKIDEYKMNVDDSLISVLSIYLKELKETISEILNEFNWDAFNLSDVFNVVPEIARILYDFLHTVNFFIIEVIPLSIFSPSDGGDEDW